jgi:hypothetical protein
MLGEINKQVSRSTRLFEVVTERSRATGVADAHQDFSGQVVNDLAHDESAVVRSFFVVLGIAVDGVSSALQQFAHRLDLDHRVAHAGQHMFARGFRQRIHQAIDQAQGPAVPTRGDSSGAKPETRAIGIEVSTTDYTRLGYHGTRELERFADGVRHTDSGPRIAVNRSNVLIESDVE